MIRSVVIALCVLGCGTEPDPGGGGGSGSSCGEPGFTQACTCANGGIGTQICDGVDFGACGMCAPPDPDPSKVNFRAEVVPIINRSCGSGDMACHKRDAYAAIQNMDCRGWLALEDTALGSKIYAGPTAGAATGCPDRPLYERLMELAPWECSATSKYVAPGDPARSYFMNKIDGAPLCPVPGGMSEQMPPPMSMYTMTEADKAKIKQWIIEGGLNN